MGDFLSSSLERASISDSFNGDCLSGWGGWGGSNKLGEGAPEAPSSRPPPPLAVLQKAWELVVAEKVVGSCTACVVTLDQHLNQLSYANVGDSGVMVRVCNNKKDPTARPFYLVFRDCAPFRPFVDLPVFFPLVFVLFCFAAATTDLAAQRPHEQPGQREPQQRVQPARGAPNVAVAPRRKAAGNCVFVAAAAAQLQPPLPAGLRRPEALHQGHRRKSLKQPRYIPARTTSV